MDSNILVYARREELPKHTQALKALTRLAEGDRSWGIPLFCIAEFVRVVTHSRLFAPPTAVPSAFEFVECLLESPTAHLLMPGHNFLKLFSRMTKEGRVHGNLVFDAQIAAVCVESGAETILTEDSDFSRFEGLRVTRL